MPKMTRCMNPQHCPATALPCQSCISSIGPAEHWALTGSITLIAVASLALAFECQRAWHARFKIPQLPAIVLQNIKKLTWLVLDTMLAITNNLPV